MTAISAAIGSDRHAPPAACAAPTANEPADASAAWTGRATMHVREPELVAGVRAERVVRHQLVGDVLGQRRRRGRGRRRSPASSSRSKTGSAARCSRSMSRSASSTSTCELTETYSPAAIDIAPATRPATPATRIWAPVGLCRGDADDQARRRHDAVVGAEHGGAQPADALAAMALARQRRGARRRAHAAAVPVSGVGRPSMLRTRRSMMSCGDATHLAHGGRCYSHAVTGRLARRRPESAHKM